MNSQKRIPLQDNVILNLLRKIIIYDKTEDLESELVSYLKEDVKKHGTDFICFGDLLSRTSIGFKKLTDFHLRMMTHEDQKMRDVYANDFYYIIIDKNFSQTDFGKYFNETGDYYKRKYGLNLDTL